MRKTVFAVLFSIICGSLSSPLFAQDVAPTAPSTQSQAAPAAQDVPQIQLPQSNFAAQFMKDEAGLWSSPFRVKRGDAKWLLPVGAGAAALLAIDHRVADVAQRDEGLRSPSKFIS